MLIGGSDVPQSLDSSYVLCDACDMPDLTASEPPVSFFTVQVRDFKAGTGADGTSPHGLFTDVAEAEAFARTVGVDAYPDFIEAQVVLIGLGSLVAVSHAQQIGWIPPTA